MIAVVLLAVSASAAAAQCSDGTPPPCRAGTVASRVRADPPLDARTWIVIPFQNVAKSTDVEWLRDASANLLYLDMSRWQDIRVIDDEKVADYMREIPDARNGVSLNAGLAVARRAGAGRLVMGDLLKIGSRISVVAKVFDVRSSQRLRSPRQETSVQDSIVPMFSRLAREILNVEPPAGTTLGEVGTSSVEAYQDYLVGVRLMNAFELVPAAARFQHALTLDSTFALAHYKLAQALLWRSGTDTAGGRHAATAVRFSGKLPPRERTLIKGFSYFPLRDYGAWCELMAPMLRADSTDIDALGAMADCMFHDAVVVPLPGDSTRFKFRYSWNESLRLFRKALSIDPTYLLGYQHLIDAMGRTVRPASVPAAAGRPAANYFSVIQRVGDTIAVEPRLNASPRLVDSLLFDPVTLRSRQANLDAAEAVAKEWLAASPGEPRAHLALARIHSSRGRPDLARTEYAAIKRGLNPGDSASLAGERFDASLRVLDIPEVVRLADSARNSESFEALVVAGHLTRFDSALSAIMTRQNGEPALIRYVPLRLRVAMGLPVDTAALLSAEKQIIPPAEASRPGMGLLAIRPTLGHGLMIPRVPSPEMDTSTQPMVQLAVAAARHDVAKLRQLGASYDSTARRNLPAQTGDGGAWLLAARAYLAAGDSAKALAIVSRFLDHDILEMPLFGIRVAFVGMPTAILVPTAMIMRADLEAAAGHSAEAKKWYGRVILLWSHADPELAPVIDRLKRAQARLP